MLSHRTLLLTFTLLIAFSASVGANANASPNLLAHRRQANRMIKMRAPADLGLIGVGEDPASGSNTATGTGASATTSQTTSGSSSSSSASSTSSSSSATSTSSSSSSSSKASSTSSSSSSASTSSSSSSSSSLSSSTSQSLAVTAAPAVDPTSSAAKNPVTSTVTNVASDNAASATESASITGATSSGLSKTAITVIAVIGGSIAGAVLIWTIIRKWKFSPSAEFEERMQPIDWSPEATHAGSAGLDRAVSNASHGSFHSHAADSSNHGHGPRNLISDIPQHDFTAGAAQLGVGGGYADLQRGTDPAMVQGSHGASFGRGYGY